MSHTYSEEEKKHLKAAQEDAHKLLQDPVSFNKRFEELFSKYDKNRDGLIGFEEYRAFISEMLISMGRTKVQSQLLLTYFQRADNDSSGQIEKEEFRKEFKKRLREFYMMNF
jgi:Ca2+-binding EF-hand superfamily protein